MRLLAIETATEACSAALWLDGEVRERYEIAPRRHAELILPMVESLLGEAGLGLAQLDGIAFGRGPGAFTGVRIGVGVVQGLAFGADLPVVPVSTLAALAQGCLREHGCNQVLAAIDARMNEVYWGEFRAEAGRVRPVNAESVTPPERLLPPKGTGWFGCGSGWATYGEALEAQMGAALDAVDPAALPHAGDVAVLAAADFAAGLAQPAEQALPVYLRDDVVKKPTAN